MLVDDNAEMRSWRGAVRIERFIEGQAVEIVSVAGCDHCGYPDDEAERSASGPEYFG
jgi:hypothetical protein